MSCSKSSTFLIKRALYSWLLTTHLQRTATHCNTLQHTTAHCNSQLLRRRKRAQYHEFTSPHTPTHCNTLQHTATHCNTLQHTATDDFENERESSISRFYEPAHWNTLQYTATQCNTLQQPTFKNERVSSVQGGEDSQDPLSCRSFSTKEPLNIGHFCGKWLMKKRDPMSLRHPVSWFYEPAHCNTLQHTATHCNTLQHTATHCNTLQLQHTATHCNTLQPNATYCNTLQHTATHYNPLQHTATHSNTLLIITIYEPVHSTRKKYSQNSSLQP